MKVIVLFLLIVVYVTLGTVIEEKDWIYNPAYWSLYGAIFGFIWSFILTLDE